MILKPDLHRLSRRCSLIYVKRRSGPVRLPRLTGMAVNESRSRESAPGRTLADEGLFVSSVFGLSAKQQAGREGGDHGLEERIPGLGEAGGGQLGPSQRAVRHRRRAGGGGLGLRCWLRCRPVMMCLDEGVSR